MNPETLIHVQNIIEKFGFPIFVAPCGLILFTAGSEVLSHTVAIGARLEDTRGMDLIRTAVSIRAFTVPPKSY